MFHMILINWDSEISVQETEVLGNTTVREIGIQKIDFNRKRYI